MNCIETKRRLEPFLDGELEVESNLEILRHLGLCPPCSRTFEGEKRLRELLVEKAAAAPGCPAAVAQRIRSAVSAEPAPGVSARWARILVPAAAAAVAAGFFAWSHSAPVPLTPERIASVALRHHEGVRARPAGLALEPDLPSPRAQERIAGYFEARGEKSCLHCLEAKGYAWFRAEASTRDFQGRVACWTAQRNRTTGTLVSHTALRLDEVEHDWREGEKLVRVEREGRTVLLFRGTGYV